MKNNQQSNSQQSKPKPVPQETKVKEVPQETEGLNDAEDDYVDDDEEEIPEIEQKVEEKPIVKEKPIEKVDPKINAEQQIEMEIAMLQDNGRFRIELLHQLQEINKALVVVAGVLVDLAGKDDKK